LETDAHHCSLNKSEFKKKIKERVSSLVPPRSVRPFSGYISFRVIQLSCSNFVLHLKPAVLFRVESLPRCAPFITVLSIGGAFFDFFYIPASWSSLLRNPLLTK
jgi:hypothetical protein